MRDVPVPDYEIIDPPARRALVDPEFHWYNRDQCRSPIPWTAAPNGHGFSTGRPWLRLADDADRRNVEVQAADPASVLATYRRLIRRRATTEPLLTGRLERVPSGADDPRAHARLAEVQVRHDLHSWIIDHRGSRVHLREECLLFLVTPDDPEEIVQKHSGAAQAASAPQFTSEPLGFPKDR